MLVSYSPCQYRAAIATKTLLNQYLFKDQNIFRLKSEYKVLLSQQFAGQANLNLSSVSAHSEEDSNSSLTYSEQNLTSPMFSQSSSGNRCSLDSEERPNFDLNNAFYPELPAKIDEDKNMREAIFDKFVKEEQVLKFMGKQQTPPIFSLSIRRILHLDRCSNRQQIQEEVTKTPMT